jgi:putative addiction module component (TIGR02574 family)
MIRHLAHELLSLPVDQRAELADLLLQNLNPDPDPALEKAWVAETERRLEAFAEGKLEAVDGDDCIARLKKKYSE